MSDTGTPRPSRRDRARPAEILGLAAVFGIFVGLAVLFAVRELVLALEFAGATFVVSIVVATLLLAMSKPETPDDLGGDDPSGHGGH